MVLQVTCVRIVEEDDDECKRKKKDSWQYVEVGVNKLYGVVCLGVNKANVGEVSDSHHFSQVGSTRFALS